jgi:hypothetical protein
MGRSEMYTAFCGKLVRKCHLEDLGVDGRRVLKWDFNRYKTVVGWICMDKNMNVQVASWTRSTAFSYLTSLR